MTDVERIAGSLTEAMKRNLLALPSKEDVWMTVAEMRGAGATGSGLDILYVMRRRDQFCDRRWVKWGCDPGQKRGEGYEYSILPNGLAVQAHLKEQKA